MRDYASQRIAPAAERMVIVLEEIRGWAACDYCAVASQPASRDCPMLLSVPDPGGGCVHC
ncbi:hypothetical protein RSAG8_01544, partial [Rhizoctonia solani AG-8 WAC10335]